MERTKKEITSRRIKDTPRKSVASKKNARRTRLEEALRISKKSEEALRESEERFAKAFKISPYSYLIAGLEDGRIIEVNDAFTVISGFTREEAIGSSTLALKVWEDEKARQLMVSTIREGRTVSGLETRLRAKNGTMRTVLLFAQALRLGNKPCILSIIEDITERKRAEETLLTVQKLESLGILAGGIAHDFNNLLGGIFGYVDLARCGSKEPETVKYLSAIIDTMNRARGLTMQLLTFAKGGSPVLSATPIAKFIEETVKFALSGSSVSCRYRLAGNLWPCNIDKNQIGQVVDNIIINAQQAMPGGGSIDVSAENITFKENRHPIPANGNFVRLSIKDSGIGIPKEILPRIFDPFFTTKTRGHGLGLSTCFSIIKRHGGAIEVDSEPGKGSTFHVYLPASTAVAVAGPTMNSKHTGAGLIVVADDEAVIRTMLGNILVSLGYSVELTNDCKQAIDFLIGETKAGRQCAAMIFDLTIPGGMGGMEAAGALRKFNGEIPIFAASGYADDPVMKNPVAYGFTGSISKPFTISELSELLNKHLKK